MTARKKEEGPIEVSADLLAQINQPKEEPKKPVTTVRKTISDTKPKRDMTPKELERQKEREAREKAREERAAQRAKDREEAAKKRAGKVDFLISKKCHLKINQLLWLNFIINLK